MYAFDPEKPLRLIYGTFYLAIYSENRTFYGTIKLGMPPATIEKDFWVCWTLKKLFTLRE
jgi:hypothetical protein